VSSLVVNRVLLLSPRQEEILTMLASGYTIKEIARQLSIDVRTISHHKQIACLKLDARTTIEAVAIWQREASK